MISSVIGCWTLSCRRCCTSCIRSRVVIREKSCAWQQPELRKLYEDDWILAVSKPGTLLVHYSKEARREEKERKAFLKDLVELQHTQGRPIFTVHRLDRGASGVILFAKDGFAAHGAQLALAHDDTVKEYLVLARGCTPESFICDDPVNDEKSVVNSGYGRPPDLHIFHFASDAGRSKVYIKTGRWHQIRKHLNHKVIGDGSHGKGQTNQYFRENYQMPPGRCFLHAARLTIPHPSTFSSHCIKKQLPPGSTTLNMKNPEMELEQIQKGHMGSRNMKSGRLPQALLKSSTGMQTGNCPQTLTLRASLPSDLRQVLLALPDGLSGKFLDSLEVVA